MFAKSLGLAMKAMKALKKGPALRKGILKKKKDEEGSKNVKPMKKPASSTPNLPLPEEKGMSLEEKMDQFTKKGNQNIHQFLDSLSKQQRESLWQRFSAARQAMRDPAADAVWEKHCKGKGSDKHKKKLLECYLKNKGLKRSEQYQKEIISLSKTSGTLPELIEFLNCVLATALKHVFL